MTGPSRIVQKSPSAANGDVKAKVKIPRKLKKSKQLASIRETMSFVFTCGHGSRVIFFIGTVAAFFNGLVGPMLAVLFSLALASASGVGVELDDVAFEDIKRVCGGLVLVGVWAFFMTFVQTVCFEIAAFRASRNLNLQWFGALLRQDAAFFDVYDVSGIASHVQPTCYLYRRGMGSKLGEGIQYITTVVGGIGFAFVASWRISVLVFAVLPFTIISSVAAIHISQTRTARANQMYKKAGAIAYSTISSLRTVLAFNAVPQMIEKYREATGEAAKNSRLYLVKFGLINGIFISSYIALFVAVSMYGASLLYNDVAVSGCDPTAGIFTDAACSTTGANIIGSFLGFLFAAEGMSQVATFFEAFTEARVAAFEALRAINRQVGAPKEIIYHDEPETKANKNDDEQGDTESESDDDMYISNTKPTSGSHDDEAAILGTFSQKIGFGCCRNNNAVVDDIEQVHNASSMENVKAILPKFEIDSFERIGRKPHDTKGQISFRKVCFSYPARPADLILSDFSLDIEAGQTVALVGPSGGGKSTVVSMIERYYDPISGSIKLDGINIRRLNLPHLRGMIGYVGQEPTLFATTIRENIEYGFPGATNDQIVAAARMANAHDFICSFPCGYDTQVGDKGSQLSGGQKQRIALARILIGKPRVLLLDEATSALDSESELIVQNAIDKILAQKKITTIIIAHRLSTIRNADVIAVVVDGKVIEKGAHNSLMEGKDSYYRKLVEKQEAPEQRISVDSKESEEGSGFSAELEEVTSESEVTVLDAPNSIELRSCCKSPARKVSSSIEAIYHQEGPLLDAPHICFKNVGFSYPSRPTKPIFHGFNLSIHRGETVALVGPSGGGKSTTVAMIERYYDPDVGSIDYMGHDLRSLNLQWYRDQIGFVSQEPNLLNDTIAKNIAFGSADVNMEMIVEAAKQANAHEFIESFPQGYDTPVGNGGTQLSGGQKQRVSIARALVRRPKVLVLDEATSALDSESEAHVQEALDKLMASRDHTTILIAHRLSTVRNADRIAFIADGKVHEIGSHRELMQKHNGRYKRLVASQKRESTLLSLGLLPESPELLSASEDENDEESSLGVGSELEGLGTDYFSAKRVWREAAHDLGFVIVGSVGSIINGTVFPSWGIMFAQTIDLLFHRVESCQSDDMIPIEGFDTCQEFWAYSAASIRNQSIQVGLSWAVVVLAALVGSTCSKVGFGTAAEKLNKRVRDSTFISLVRQEVSFFDKHSIGRITSVLQDDTTKLYSFTGEPLRMFWIGMSSVAIGITLAFFYVWPVALLSLGCIPLMGYALSLRMGKVGGKDRGGSTTIEVDSPGGILVETLLNIRTVAALTMEKRRFEDFKLKLRDAEPNNHWSSARVAVTHGMAYLLHHFVDALLLFFAGWLLHSYPDQFTFLSLLNSNFALYFSLFGLGIALKEVADREQIKLAASRVFYVLDRPSQMDPLDSLGKQLY